MKIKIDQSIKNFDGNIIEVGEKDKTILTFRSVIETTLNSQSESHPLTSEKKLQAFQIGVKLFSKKLPEYDLTVDQITFIKERIGLFYGPVIYGRFLELIGDEAVKSETS
jgi:hypothetical protein